MTARFELEGRHVVVTGASGALGGAVVETLAAAGAVLHLPLRAGNARLPPGAAVQVVEGIDLADEASVASFYGALPPLWASVHVAGGFAEAPLLATSVAALRAQLDLNLTTAFLCCREAARNLRGRGGRILNVGARSALAPTGGSVGYTDRQGGGRGDDDGARRRARRRRHPRERDPAGDHRYAGEPCRHAGR